MRYFIALLVTLMILQIAACRHSSDQSVDEGKNQATAQVAGTAQPVRKASTELQINAAWELRELVLSSPLSMSMGESNDGRRMLTTISTKPEARLIAIEFSLKNLTKQYLNASDLILSDSSGEQHILFGMNRSSDAKYKRFGHSVTFDQAMRSSGPFTMSFSEMGKPMIAAWSVSKKSQYLRLIVADSTPVSVQLQ